MKGEITGQLVNVFTRETYPAKIEWENGIFTSIEELGRAPEHFIIPGLIDAHIHMESSFLCPSRFAELVGHAKMSLCEVSFRALGLEGDVPGIGYKDFATQARHAEMVEDYPHYLVL